MADARKSKAVAEGSDGFCLSTSGRIHSEFLRLLYFIADKQASDYSTDLSYEPHKEEFCHAAASTSTSISAPLAWHELRLLRFVVPPTSCAVMLPCLVPCNYELLSTIGSAMTSTSVSELKL